MAKLTLRQILARNIAEAMAKSPGLDTQPALAARAGVAQSQISRILRCEIGVGIDALQAIAEALDKHPGELLMDREEIRRLVVERFLATPAVPDARVERHLPAVPGKVVAMRQRRRK